MHQFIPVAVLALSLALQPGAVSTSAPNTLTGPNDEGPVSGAPR